MKTFKRVVEKPKLVIEHDQDSESPREYENLGVFVTSSSRYNSPDGEDNEEYRVMIDCADSSNADEHAERIKAELEAKYVFPINKYEHSCVSYSIGTSSGFDNGVCGFYIVYEDISEKEAEEIINEELKTYTQWCNGEVYGFTLYDDNGEIEDSCWSFYDIEDIRDSLPKEWEDENLYDYIKYI